MKHAHGKNLYVLAMLAGLSMVAFHSSLWYWLAHLLVCVVIASVALGRSLANPAPYVRLGGPEFLFAAAGVSAIADGLVVACLK